MATPSLQACQLERKSSVQLHNIGIGTCITPLLGVWWSWLDLTLTPIPLLCLCRQVYAAARCDTRGPRRPGPDAAASPAASPSPASHHTLATSLPTCLQEKRSNGFGSSPTAAAVTSSTPLITQGAWTTNATTTTTTRTNPSPLVTKSARPW